MTLITTYSVFENEIEKNHKLVATAMSPIENMKVVENLINSAHNPFRVKYDRCTMFIYLLPLL